MKATMYLIGLLAAAVPLTGMCGVATCSQTKTTGFTIPPYSGNLFASIGSDEIACVVVTYEDPDGETQYVPDIAISIDGITRTTSTSFWGACDIQTDSGEVDQRHSVVFPAITYQFPSPLPGTQHSINARVDWIQFQTGTYQDRGRANFSSGSPTVETDVTDRWQVPDTIALERGATDDEDTGPTFDGPVGPASGTLQYHDTSHTGDEDAPHIVNLTTGADDAGTINPGDKWGVRLRGNTPGEWTGTITAALTCP